MKIEKLEDIDDWGRNANIPIEKIGKPKHYVYADEKRQKEFEAQSYMRRDEGRDGLTQAAVETLNELIKFFPDHYDMYSHQFAEHNWGQLYTIVTFCDRRIKDQYEKGKHTSFLIFNSGYIVVSKSGFGHTCVDTEMILVERDFEMKPAALSWIEEKEDKGKEYKKTLPECSKGHSDYEYGDTAELLESGEIDEERYEVKRCEECTLILDISFKKEKVKQ